MESIKYQSFDRHQPGFIRSEPGSECWSYLGVNERSKQRRDSQMKYNFKTRRSKYIRHRLFSCFSHLHIFKHHAFVRECRSEDLLHDEVRKTHMNH